MSPEVTITTIWESLSTPASHGSPTSPRSTPRPVALGISSSRHSMQLLRRSRSWHTRHLSDLYWSMPHAPGHLTPKWTRKSLRGYSERQPGLSQVITSITPALLQCSKGLSGTRWRSDGAFEMLPCFLRSTMVM